MEGHLGKFMRAMACVGAVFATTHIAKGQEVVELTNFDVYADGMQWAIHNTLLTSQ